MAQDRGKAMVREMVTAMRATKDTDIRGPIMAKSVALVWDHCPELRKDAGEFCIRIKLRRSSLNLP